ncbi:hypothetical protein SAY87_011556 [Trapa incisa]|uniref:Beta-amylase n=1 Tax=Trapa incisa TaxID=236973 RepID=A0AAN7GWH2_9MYRT|nr:hypothetical protein SAY87_011556 [Trapa incisa]
MVPVFVMLPLDNVTLGGNLNKPRAMNASLMALKNAGVEGVMVDAWWGFVEKDGPLKYNWEGYAELIQMVARNGLKLQVVATLEILAELSKNPDLVYSDRSGRRNPEYISLGCDTLPVLLGRTPIQEIQVGMGPCGELRYPAYPESNGTWRFPGIGEFQCYDKEIQVGMGPCGELRYPAYPESNGTWRFPGIGEFQCYDKEIQVGMGPCGELRYPAYPESNGTWRFPGIGEFQCYDKYMRASLQASAESIGQKDWEDPDPMILASTINFLKTPDFSEEKEPVTLNMDNSS